MSLPIHQLHNVLRTYEKAFKPAPPTPPQVQTQPPQGNDRVSISQEALTKLGATTQR